MGLFPGVPFYFLPENFFLGLKLAFCPKREKEKQDTAVSHQLVAVAGTSHWISTSTCARSYQEEMLGSFLFQLKMTFAHFLMYSFIKTYVYS